MGGESPLAPHPLWASKYFLSSYCIQTLGAAPLCKAGRLSFGPVHPETPP